MLSRSHRIRFASRGRALGMKLGEPLFGPAYGLTIHEQKKFVYVRVPKVATHSMASFLAGSLTPPPTWHRRAFMPKNLDDWFVFTVVRNPWDRIAASWKEKVVAATNPMPFYKPWVGQPFEAFLQHLTTVDLDTVEDHVRRQTALVPLEDLDFVARLEEIAIDIDVITSKVGIKSDALQTLNRSPKSVRGSYRDVYDDTTRQIIAELYADEINRFAYNFDGPLPR